jgi:uncharacterized protein
MLDNRIVKEPSATRINMFIKKIANSCLCWTRILTAALWTKFTGLHHLVTALVLLTVLSTSGCAWLDAKQRNIIYRPTPGVPADFAGLRATDERYFLSVPPSGSASIALSVTSAVSTTSSSTTTSSTVPQIEMWWLPHADVQAPTLLYFHGTFRNLYQNLRKIDALREAGFAILAVEYRGWGRSTPIIPSEQTIVQDAQVAFDELRRREVRPSYRVIYGHSMGSGVAVDIASRLKAPNDYAVLILESAMTSLPDVATEASWLGPLARLVSNERFASIDKIAKIQAPLLMLHGSDDKTIPIKLGERLFNAANAPKLWLRIEGGGHSDLQQVGSQQYQGTLQNFKNKYVLGR